MISKHIIPSEKWLSVCWSRYREASAEGLICALEPEGSFSPIHFGQADPAAKLDRSPTRCLKCQETYMLARSCVPSYVRGLLLLCLSTATVGCGNPSGLDSVQVPPTSQSLAVGQTAQFTAVGTFGN